MASGWKATLPRGNGSGAPCRRRWTATLPGVGPDDFAVATTPNGFAEVGVRHAAIGDVVHDLQPRLDMYEHVRARA